MTYSTTLKLNQRFETYNEFLSVVNINMLYSFFNNYKLLFFLISFLFFNKLTSLYLTLVLVHSVNQELPIFPTVNQEPPIFPDFPEK